MKTPEAFIEEYADECVRDEALVALKEYIAEARAAAFRECKRIVNIGCYCPSKSLWSGEEWDGRHAFWCPVTVQKAIEEAAKR